MDPQTNSQPAEEKENTTMYYVIGAVVLVAVLVAGYFLRPKPQQQQQATGGAQQQQIALPAPTTTPGPITGLACENQYYNPVVAIPGQYFLSVEGADLATATSETCEFTVMVKNNVVATLSKEATPEANATRGGSTFRCTTDKLTLERNVPTKVDVAIKNNEGKSVTCSRTFLLP